RARALVAQVSGDSLSGLELTRQYLTLAPAEQAALGNELLRAYGSHPESVQLRTAVGLMNPFLKELMDAGALNPHAQFVIQVALEQYRIQRAAELTGITGGAATSLNLDPHRARLALDTAQPQAPVRRRVTVDETGTIHTTDTTPADAAYANEIYAMGPFDEGGLPALPAPLRQELIHISSQWHELALTLGDAGFPTVYEGVKIALENGGVRPNAEAEILPTAVAITRAPNGRIAAIGLHSFDDQEIWNDYVATDANLRVRPRPAGEYWLGAGRENTLFALRELVTRYPGRTLRAYAVNSQALRNDVSLYYNEEDSAHLLPGLTVSDWGPAAQSLIRRKINLVTRALTELEAAGRAHVTPAESARIAGLRTRLTQLSTRAASAQNLQEFMALDRAVDTARVDTAAASQAMRRAHPGDITLEGLGSNAQFVDTRFQPTSDALHAEYTELVQDLTAQGQSLPDGLADRPGTPEDFSRLFKAIGLEGSPAQAEILESFGDGATPLPEQSLAQFQREVEATLDRKAASVSALVESYGESPSTVLAQILTRDTAWILKFYREGKLSPSARLVVETQLERVRATDAALRTIHGTTGDQLFLDPARTDLALDTLPPRTEGFLDYTGGRSTPGTTTGLYGNQSYVLVPEADVPWGRTRLAPADLTALQRRVVTWFLAGLRLRLPREVSNAYARMVITLSNASAGRISDANLHLMVTRNPAGEIVAASLYGYDTATQTVTIETTVENAHRHA
ncbi:MAG: hypothetical protein MI749_22295, partial [Desulfovibrionales bacterium]|nr:hypothetical protein [Desulfovibrionales bacterium]